MAPSLSACLPVCLSVSVTFRHLAPVSGVYTCAGVIMPSSRIRDQVGNGVHYAQGAARGTFILSSVAVDRCVRQVSTGQTTAAPLRKRRHMITQHRAQSARLGWKPGLQTARRVVVVVLLVRWQERRGLEVHLAPMMPAPHPRLLQLGPLDMLCSTHAVHHPAAWTPLVWKSAALWRQAELT